MLIIRQKFISRADLRANPEVIYLFGDNLLRSGLGGQAKEMRGEPNAIGIPTKKEPKWDQEAYFTDAELNQNKEFIRAAFRQVKERKPKVVVIPADGLGTGRAALDKTAPETFNYLQACLRWLEIMEIV